MSLLSQLELTGYIDYIQTSKKDPDLVEIIWVKFHNKTVGKKCYKGSVNKKKWNMIYHQLYPFWVLWTGEHLHLRPRGSELYLDEDALPILPVRQTFEVTDSGNQHFIRKQFALTLAYAKTAHKVQGESLQKVSCHSLSFMSSNIYYYNENSTNLSRSSWISDVTKTRESGSLYQQVSTLR